MDRKDIPEDVKKYIVSLETEIQELKRISSPTNYDELPDLLYLKTVDWKIFFDTAPIAIHIVRNGVSIYANEYFINLFGYDNVEQIIGQEEGEFIHPKFREEAVKRGLQREAGLNPRPHNEIIALKKDGTPFYALTAATTITLQGRPAVMAYIIDISERVEAKIDLINSNQRYQAVLNVALDAILVIKQNGRIIEFNKSAEEIFGYKKEEVIGMRMQDTVIPKKKQSEFEELTKITDYEDGKSFSRVIETTAKHKNGKLIPIELSIFRIELKDDVLFIGSIHDLTEKLQSAKKAEELKYQLWRVQKRESMGLLASGIAHDFKNILTVIEGTTSLLQLERKEDEEIQEYTNTILNTITQAIDLTNQLQSYASKSSVKKKAVDINSVIIDVADLLELSTTGSINLEYDLQDGLDKVIADTSQLKQILLNLVVNATEAIENCGTIKIETAQESIKTEKKRLIIVDTDIASSKFVMFRVCDNGTGIAEQKMEKIFEPFYSDKSYSRGLGLAVIQEIISDHRGGLSVYSKEGEGTIFEISLPVTH